MKKGRLIAALLAVAVVMSSGCNISLLKLACEDRRIEFAPYEEPEQIQSISIINISPDGRSIETSLVVFSQEEWPMIMGWLKEMDYRRAGSPPPERWYGDFIKIEYLDGYSEYISDVFGCVRYKGEVCQYKHAYFNERDVFLDKLNAAKGSGHWE